MMGMLPSCSHKLYNPGAGMLLYFLYTWILLSAMFTLVCSIKLCTDSPTSFENGTTIPAMLGKPVSVVFCVQCQPRLYIAPYIQINHANHPKDRNYYYPNHTDVLSPIIVNITPSAYKATINITIKEVQEEDFTDQFSVIIHTNKSVEDSLFFVFHLSNTAISRNQTRTTVTTDASSDNSSGTAGDEAKMGTTENIQNTTTSNRITKTKEDVNNNQGQDDIENMSTTDTTFDSSFQSAVSSNSTHLLLTTSALPNATGSNVEEWDVNRNNITTATITSTTTEAVTNVSLYYTNETTTVTEATDVTSTTDISTTAYQNTSDSIDGVDRTKPGDAGLSKIKLLVMTITAVTAFFVVIFVIAIIVYFHGGRCRQTKRHTEEEYVDCDHELYTTLSVYTNFRHHGARAAYQPLNLKDDRLITKMEVDEVDDDNCTDNTMVDVEDTADSGRYLSPEGLIYVTVEHANRKTKASSNTQKDVKTVHYATVDFNKTNNLFTKLQKHEKNKKKRKEEYRKKR